MALSDAQRLYCMYVIGAVESNWNWTAVNYADPITLGMLQWYGTRAAGLLEDTREQAPAAYDLLAQSLKNDLEAHSTTDSFWNSRYLTRAEGNSFIEGAKLDAAHVVQQNLFFSDLQNYERVLGSWGCETDTPARVKSFIFICSMYHQSPKRAGEVVAALGGTASVASLYAGAMNNSVLSRYKTRYTRVKNYLDSWDGVSAPPDFGQVGDIDTTPGGDGTGYIDQLLSDISSIRMAGGNLIIYGADNSRLICYKTQQDVWVPQRNIAAPNTPSKPGGSGGSTPDQITQMQNLWRQNQNKWSYGQGAGRLTPTTSGYSDCSACIWWAVNKINPAAAKSMGSSTAAMLQNKWDIIASGGAGQYPTEDQCKTGDILIVNWKSTNIAASGRHVEWVFPDYQLWGAGRAPLPHPSGSVKDYILRNRPRSWQLRRGL